MYVVTMNFEQCFFKHLLAIPDLMRLFNNKCITVPQKLANLFPKESTVRCCCLRSSTNNFIFSAICVVFAEELSSNGPSNKAYGYIISLEYDCLGATKQKMRRKSRPKQPHCREIERHRPLADPPNALYVCDL